MKILLLGKNGQLGWELHRAFMPLGEVLAFDLPEINLTNPESVTRIIEYEKPELVLNAAAYTDVDKAEEQNDIAQQVNGVTPGILASACMKNRSVFIHYSTDYVFNGRKGSPYKESDAPNPINVYGKSKLAGEDAVTQVGGVYLTLRTSWVYSMRKGGFVSKVLDWSHKQKELHIVDDQVGSPTWARVLAEITAMLIAGYRVDLWEQIRDCAGIYHLAGDGIASRYEWAKAILDMELHPKDRVTEKIVTAKSADFPTPAERPHFSGLDCSHFYSVFNMRLPPWRMALKLALSLEE